MNRRLIIFLLLLAAFAPPSGAASTSAESSPLATVKNRLASIADRKQSIDQLRDGEEPGLTQALLGIIQEKREPAVLRAYAGDLLIEKKDEESRIGLDQIVKNAELGGECRMLALYALWKIEPESMAGRLKNLAQDPNEIPDLRIAAIQYLAELGENPPGNFWAKLATQKDNPAPVRIAALSAMEKIGLLADDPSILTSSIQAVGGPVLFRKHAVETAKQVFAPLDYQHELIAVLMQPKNPLEIRRFALDNLSDRPDPALLPNLRDLILYERDPDLKRGLQELVKTLTPSKH